MKDGEKITSFLKSEQEFNLKDQFTLGTSNSEFFDVVLKEEEIIKAIYKNPDFYGSLGREFCIFFDVAFAKTGTEAIAESFS